MFGNWRCGVWKKWIFRRHCSCIMGILGVLFWGIWTPTILKKQHLLSSAASIWTLLSFLSFSQKWISNCVFKSLLPEVSFNESQSPCYLELQGQHAPGQVLFILWDPNICTDHIKYIEGNRLQKAQSGEFLKHNTKKFASHAYCLHLKNDKCEQNSEPTSQVHPIRLSLLAFKDLLRQSVLIMQSIFVCIYPSNEGQVPASPCWSKRCVLQFVHQVAADLLKLLSLRCDFGLL